MWLFSTRKMPSTCAVAVCKNTSRNCRYKFHGFPRTFEIRAQRIQKCYRNDTLNPNPRTARICQVHFLKEHYYEGLPKKLKLKWDVIPNQNLKPADKEGKKNNMSRSERMRKRKKIENVVLVILVSQKHYWRNVECMQ